jgi:GH24 family phage-related lysozyme (muramidase)
MAVGAGAAGNAARSGRGTGTGGSGLSGGGQDSGSNVGNKGMGSYGSGSSRSSSSSSSRGLFSGLGDLFSGGLIGALGDVLGPANKAAQAANMSRQRDKTSNRGGGPEGPAKQTNLGIPTFGPTAPATEPDPPQALREAADLQNYFSDLQNIARGGLAAQQALARFGIAPEQSYFQYRESFPEFGDLSGTSGGLAGIIRSLGKMSRTPESFAEGGRAGESMGRRDIQTDVGKFGQMLRDLMLMTDEPTGRQARQAMAEEAGYISPAIAQREGALYQPGGLIPRVAETIEVSPLPPPGMSRERTQRERELARVRREGNLYQPGGLMPRVAETGSPRYGGDAEAFRFVMPPRDNSPLNIIPDRDRPEIEVSPLPPPGMSRERTQRERELARLRLPSQAERDLMEAVRNEPDITEMLLRDRRSMTDEPTGMSREMTQRERELSRSRRMSQDEGVEFERLGTGANIYSAEALAQLEAEMAQRDSEARDLMEAVRNEPDITEVMPPVPGEEPELNYQPEIFAFIRQEEGSESEGYTLPVKDYPLSGVTIANGLDLGQQDEDSLRRMGLTDDLIELFTPYFGLQGADAKAFLEENPLFISPEQKSFIEDKLNEDDYKRFSNFWNSSETYTPWENLKPEQQAVLLSVFRQYGNLPTETKNFWGYASTGDWDGVLRELRDFKDETPDRRNREADLLETGFAKGGPVYRRNEALPMIEGDHVVPAKAVKGNEGGLASLSRRLSGNPSYDGMIRGPGGPRDDAIKTRVYAAGGGISGMMDNLQNPFNSVPARVSNKEYVIPRDAINNLGRMAGAPEGMANKAGQDIIYQLVENLKRKA